MADYAHKATTNRYRYDEAADEIERLRAALEPFTRILDVVEGHDPTGRKTG
jgi:hypothetical protein